MKHDRLMHEVEILCERSKIHSMYSKLLLLHHQDTNMIQEGVFIETSRVILADVVKNLLSTGAVALTGGAAGDTIVDAMYAIERTRQVIQAYESIKASAGILLELFNDLDNVQLTNNIDTIAAATKRSVALIANQYDTVAGAGEASGELRNLQETTDEIKEEFMEFFRAAAKSVSTWVSTLIPDDGGNIGTFFNVTLVTLADQASDKPLSTLIELVNKLPGDLSGVVFDQNALEAYLTNLCNVIADAIDNQAQGETAEERIMNLKSRQGEGEDISALAYTKEIGHGALEKMKSFQDFSAKYNPMGVINKYAGKGAKSAAETLGSEHGDYYQAIFDGSKMADIQLSKFEELIEAFPIYIREELIPLIPEAVQTYATVMKYIISFLSLLEAARTGELAKLSSPDYYQQLLAQETDMVAGDDVAEEEQFISQQDLVAEIRGAILKNQHILVDNRSY